MRMVDCRAVRHQKRLPEGRFLAAHGDVLQAGILLAALAPFLDDEAGIDLADSMAWRMPSSRTRGNASKVVQRMLVGPELQLSVVQLANHPVNIGTGQRLSVPIALMIAPSKRLSRCFSCM